MHWDIGNLPIATPKDQEPSWSEMGPSIQVYEPIGAAILIQTPQWGNYHLIFIFV